MAATTSRVTAAAVAVLGAALLVLLIALWAASGRAQFDGGRPGLDRVDAAIQASGLQVCSTSDIPDGLANQALSSRTYVLAVSCPGDQATVVVDRFADPGDRDAAARQFESLLRPRGSGVVYTLGEVTVFVRGSSDDAVQDRLDVALRAEGAQ